MKKTYFSPALKVVKVQTQYMIAASGTDMLVGGSQDLGSAPTTDEVSGNLSKDSEDLWED